MALNELCHLSRICQSKVFEYNLDGFCSLLKTFKGPQVVFYNNLRSKAAIPLAPSFLDKIGF